MKARFVLPLLFPILAIAETPCNSRSFVAPPARHKAAVDAARKDICEKIAPHVPGIQVAVAVDGRLIWSEGFGHADIARRKPVSRTTMFRIGSLSKQLTAHAVAVLAEKGSLDLDAPVQTYVPSFPKKQWPVTPRQLVGHLGGIRGYLDDHRENRSNVHYDTVVSGLTIFASDPLIHEPGTAFSYSTYGYSLLSATLEGAARKDFPTLMKTHVFRPMGLRHTAVDDVTRTIRNRAQVYDADDDTGALSVAPRIDNSYKWAGGGMLSTAEDLVRFASAYLRGAGLSDASIDGLFTSMRTTDGKETGYGMGWYVGRDAHGHRIVSHAGSAIGGSAMLILDRDSGVAYAMLLNVSGSAEIGELLSPTWTSIPSLFETVH